VTEAFRFLFFRRDFYFDFKIREANENKILPSFDPTQTAPKPAKNFS
jgi:hypothetical protein